MRSTEDRTDSCWQYGAAVDLELPVAKPRLPLADEIMPYLRRIDQSRWYSNGGPLVQQFEAQLATHAGGGSVATVANATIGLVLALLTYDVAPGSLCMVPSWTFAATGHAIQLAGLIPWIVDVDAATWALDPQAAREFLRNAPWVSDRFSLVGFISRRNRPCGGDRRGGDVRYDSRFIGPGSC